MRKIIQTLGLTTALLAIQVTPILANGLGVHLGAAQSAAAMTAEHLSLAATSISAGNIDIHTNQALNHLTTVEMELVQARAMSTDMVQVAMINFVLRMASHLRTLAQTTLSAPLSLKHYRAQMTWLYSHELHHQAMGL